MSQTVINNWHDRNDDKDMIKIRKECEKEVYKMYDDALAEEKRWATHLIFKRQYDWTIRKTVTPICRIHGKSKNERHWFRHHKYEQKTNPLPWVDHWLNSKGYTKRTTRNRD